MRIESIVHLKNGDVFGAQDLTNENKQNAVIGIERAKNTNGFINLYTDAGPKPIKAQEVKSIQFIFHD
ncbi:hypothetical protein ACW0TQ_08200 [Oceanobacillus sp. M60]|uniref:hypothetical protein n=1 Tax=Oceanobacillus oncorhynchi TaxID=545501 RepID=UPI00363646EF